MGNHFHLIIRLEPDGNLARFMKQVFLAYHGLYRTNHVYVGHLFQGRYKSLIIDSQAYLIKCGKYIELNPVRAGLVNRPGNYAYSSYRYYAEGAYDPLITPDPSYAGLGDTDAERQVCYRKLAIDAKAINSERLRRNAFLGSEDFVKTMVRQFGVQNTASPRGRPRRQQATKTAIVDKKQENQFNC